MAPRPEEDAYGRLLMALHEGDASDEIMERDDGLLYAGSPEEYFQPFRRWPARERKAMRFVRGRVLDVGTGAGRVALHLQERGLEVVAIDESPGAVEVARRRGVEDARTVSVADLDESLGVFDTVLLFRNNFGLIGPEDRAPIFLRRLHKLTSERARIVTDSVDPARIDDPAQKDSPGHRFRVRFRKFATPWFYYLMLAPPELEQLVDGTGWVVVRVLADDTPRYVAILEKAPLNRGGGRSSGSPESGRRTR